jgi:hypothetical protein
VDQVTAYAEFEQGASEVEARLVRAVAGLRVAYALNPDSGDHRTAVQAGFLTELMQADPEALACLLVVAIDQLARDG